MDEQLKYEEKFIVINRKRFEEVGEAGEAGARIVASFLKNLGIFEGQYEFVTGKKLDQKYHVCNQDEPYAEKVLDLILHRHPEQETRMREALERISDGTYIVKFPFVPVDEEKRFYSAIQLRGIASEALQSTLEQTNEGDDEAWRESYRAPPMFFEKEGPIKDA